MADDRNLDNENDLLREQIRLLQEANRLQRESFDISSSAVDSLKEAMGINSRRSTFESSILKINKQVAQAILDQKTGLRDIESINKQIAKNQDLLNKSKLIEKSLEKELRTGADKTINQILEKYQLQQKITQEIEDGNLANISQLNSLDDELETLLQSLSYREKLLLATKQTTQELEIQNELREGEKNVEKNLQEQLGLAGKIAKTLSHFRGIADDVNEALEDTKKKYRDIAETGGELPGKWQTFSTLIGKTFTNLSKNIGDPLVIVTQLISALKTSDEATGDMAKKMNLTYTEALRVRGELGTIASISGDAALTTKGLQESYMAVGQALGSNAMLNQQDLITMTKLTKQAGFTHDELMGIEKLSLVNGKTLEQNSQEILGGAKAYASRNKLILNEKQILREVNSASASLKLSLGGSAEQVAIAASKAKQFGLNLEQADKIAQSLLNFESSIEAELSAELLIGKNLNLEQARLLALNGQTADAAAEIAKQVGTSADFAKMNVIQQEALAKAAGMERNELAQSLMDKEALAKLSAVEGATAQEKFNNLVKQVGLEEAKKRLGEEGLANQFAQQSIQERFNQSVEKLKELFIQVAEPVLQIVSPLANLVSNVLPLINIALQPAIATLRVIGSLISGIIKLITLDFKGAMDDLSPSNLFKGYTDLFSATSNQVSSALGSTKPATPTGDLSYSNRTGETTISTKEGGLYSISPNDEIAVAPKINTRLATQSSPSSTQDNSALIAELKSLRNELSNKPFKSPDVYLDGEKISSNTNRYQRKGFQIQ